LQNISQKWSLENCQRAVTRLANAIPGPQVCAAGAAGAAEGRGSTLAAAQAGPAGSRGSPAGEMDVDRPAGIESTGHEHNSADAAADATAMAAALVSRAFAAVLSAAQMEVAVSSAAQGMVSATAEQTAAGQDATVSGQQNVVMQPDREQEAGVSATEPALATHSEAIEAAPEDAALPAPVPPLPPLAAGVAEKLAKAITSSAHRTALREHVLRKLRRSSPVFALLLDDLNARIAELQALQPPTRAASHLQRAAPSTVRADIAAFMRSSASSCMFAGFCGIVHARTEAQRLTGMHAYGRSDFMSADRGLQARAEGASKKVTLTVTKRDEP
jgi:hypothetical protein